MKLGLLTWLFPEHWFRASSTILWINHHYVMFCWSCKIYLALYIGTYQMYILSPFQVSWLHYGHVWLFSGFHCISQVFQRSLFRWHFIGRLFSISNLHSVEKQKFCFSLQNFLWNRFQRYFRLSGISNIGHSVRSSRIWH